jgi:hypothetical protein
MTANVRRRQRRRWLPRANRGVLRRADLRRPLLRSTRTRETFRGRLLRLRAGDDGTEQQRKCDADDGQETPTPFRAGVIPYVIAIAPRRPRRMTFVYRSIDGRAAPKEWAQGRQETSKIRVGRALDTVLSPQALWTAWGKRWTKDRCSRPAERRRPCTRDPWTCKQSNASGGPFAVTDPPCQRGCYQAGLGATPSAHRECLHGG